MPESRNHVRMYHVGLEANSFCIAYFTHKIILSCMYGKSITLQWKSNLWNLGFYHREIWDFHSSEEDGDDDLGFGAIQTAEDANVLEKKFFSIFTDSST